MLWGQASDKIITRDSGFYDELERDDDVISGRGCQIQEDLLFLSSRLIVPPAASLKNQITKSEIKKRKEIAKISVER